MALNYFYSILQVMCCIVTSIQISPPISKCSSAGHQLFGQKVRGLYKYMPCIKAFSFLWLIYWDWVAIWYPVVKLKSNYCARLRLIELHWMRQISVLALTVVCKQGVYGKILCATKRREDVSFFIWYVNSFLSLSGAKIALQILQKRYADKFSILLVLRI